MPEKPDTPIIIRNSKRVNDKELFTFSIPHYLPKVIFILLSLVIFVELIWAFWYLSKPIPKVSRNVVVSQSSNRPSASITLSSDKKEVSLGDYVLVNITLITNGRHTIGSDVVIKYDPNLLILAGGAKDVFTPGKTYQEYAGEKIDNKNGIFRISGINNFKDGGSSPNFGFLKFKAKAKGVALIQVNFQPGGTTDSNVIDTKLAKDILAEVKNLEIIIN